MKTRLYFSIILLSLFLSVYKNSNAQSWLWAKSFENISYGTSALDPTSQAVYTTGYFSGTVDFDPGPGTYFVNSVGVNDVFISKLDGAGNFVWVKSFGGETYVLKETYYYTNVYSYAIAVNPTNGNVYVNGYFAGDVEFDPDMGYYLTGAGRFILKLDSLGNFLWAKALGADFDSFYSIAIDQLSGDVYTTGSFTDGDFDPGSGVFILNSVGGQDVFISKLDESGNFVWVKAIGGAASDFGNSIIVDSGRNGSVYTTGSFSGTVDFDPSGDVSNLSSVGESDIFILKLDVSGNFVWAKDMGGINSDGGESIALDPSGTGDIYTIGFFYGTADFDPGPGTYNLTGGGMFFSKLNASGSFVWAKAINGDVSPGNDRSIVLNFSGNGDIYSTGYFQGTTDFDPGPGTFNLTPSGTVDIFISKLNGSGSFEWAIDAGGTNLDLGHSLAIDDYGNLIVSGVFSSSYVMFDTTTLTSTGSWNVFIAKLNEIGSPCTSIVTNTNDNGIGSLRDICSCSSSGATITFSLAPMSQITLTSGEIVINKNLSLSGLGMMDLTLSGNNASRIFHILPGKNLELENLALKNATSITNGGAIFAEGNLILENVLLQNNFENGIRKGLSVISPGGLVTINGNVDIEN